MHITCSRDYQEITGDYKPMATINRYIHEEFILPSERNFL